MVLRSRLPEHHLSVNSKDAIKLATAIVVTLSAIALGFLTASAKTAFDQAEAELRGSAAEIVLLDRALAHYGPETQAARGLLRDFIVSRLDGPSAKNAGDEFEIEAVQDQLRSLVPGTAAQRFLQARALEVSGRVSQNTGSSGMATTLKHSSAPLRREPDEIAHAGLGSSVRRRLDFKNRNPAIFTHSREGDLMGEAKCRAKARGEIGTKSPPKLGLVVTPPIEINGTNILMRSSISTPKSYDLQSYYGTS